VQHPSRTKKVGKLPPLRSFSFLTLRGVIHSPKRDGLTKLVRVEGRNLDHVQRSNIKAA
jgi:hypothetical protein